ncbi:DUF411 domain-containing protein [Hahella sp. KA22]|uniref:DUF411 domain-containing protein n=1 Tax=Hahella sp. KA22 TaxID=1628392 RepID=UPI0019D435A9|nr:DUF411 domain-containing protein [Hahella sp. KA22]
MISNIAALPRRLSGVLLALSAGFAGAQQATAEEMTVYKSPTCGCCKVWVDHVKAAGFDVTVHETRDVSPVKQQAGLAPQLASCHTAFVNGYLIEGHVPAADIQRLLQEKPDALGLSVPGMPAGENVPGMEVPGVKAKFDVLLVSKDGGAVPYSHYE